SSRWGPPRAGGWARPRRRHQAQRLNMRARIPDDHPDTRPARGCLSSSTWKGREHGSPQSAHRPPARAQEPWSKPYYERGTSAWSHRIIKAGDWLEVDALQCHIVHWIG